MLKGRRARGTSGGSPAKSRRFNAWTNRPSDWVRGGTLGARPAREPANESAEEQPALSRKADPGCQADDGAERQAHRGSKRHNRPDAHERECRWDSPLVGTSPGGLCSVGAATKGWWPQASDWGRNQQESARSRCPSHFRRFATTRTRYLTGASRPPTQCARYAAARAPASPPRSFYSADKPDDARFCRHGLSRPTARRRAATVPRRLRRTAHGVARASVGA